MTIGNLLRYNLLVGVKVLSPEKAPHALWSSSYPSFLNAALNHLKDF